MYRNTRFGELMKGLSRGAFEREVQRHQADKHSKGCRCWDQLIAMVYAQLSGCRSLRELEVGFNAQTTHHYHLGSRTIKRLTLAEANTKRSAEVFAQMCGQLLTGAKRQVKRELGDLLYLIDSTPIPLKGLGFDEWGAKNSTHRTQGLKVHMMFAPQLGLPVHAGISAPNVNDVQAGREIILETGATYVFDKGYCDYNWWNAIDKHACYFVTRFKKNAGIVQSKPLSIAPHCKDIVLEDAVVHFKNKRPGGNRITHYYDKPLRCIVVARPDKTTPLILATNDSTRSAEEIAELYKQRWGIELFFKWLKQNLKIKTFLGRSENAVKIQIYTALISYLLLQLYRQRNGITQSMMLCLVTIRSGLFQRPETEHIMAKKRQCRQREQQGLQAILAL